MTRMAAVETDAVAVSGAVEDGAPEREASCNRGASVTNDVFSSQVVGGKDVNVVTDAKTHLSHLSPAKNSFSEREKSRNEKINSQSGGVSPTLAARLCPTCGSPAFWTARPSPDVLRCRECEPPPANSLIARLLYARWATLALADQEDLPTLEWEPPSNDAAGTREGSPPLDANQGSRGPQNTSSERTEGIPPGSFLAGMVEVRCADGSWMFARPGWDNPDSPHWDELIRLTITDGRDTAWQLLSERTARLCREPATIPATTNER